MTRDERKKWQASFSREDKLCIFNQISFLSKEDVISDIRSEIDDIAAELTSCSDNMKLYWATRKDFLTRFVNKIEQTKLFDKLEPWWCYEYTISSRGAFLNIVYAGQKVLVNEEKGLFYVPTSKFTVVSLLAKTMTIDEYATYSGKTAASLRQSLRRGKYRSAFKVGQEWRISELCEPDSSRGYSDGEYEWETELIDVPEGFEYLKAPGFVSIFQNQQNKQIFYIEGITESYFRRENVSKLEVEMIEHYLIANPFVVYRADEKHFDKKRNIDVGGIIECVKQK